MTEENKNVDVNVDDKVALQDALVALETEMHHYKRDIVENNMSLSAEAVVRFQEAIAELSDMSHVTVEDVNYHTNRLYDMRETLRDASEGDE